MASPSDNDTHVQFTLPGDPPVYLTRWSTSDADRLYAVLSTDKSIHEGTLRTPWPYTRSHAEVFLTNASRPGTTKFAIRIGSPTAPVVGSLGYAVTALPSGPGDQSSLGDGEAHDPPPVWVEWEIGYWLATEARGHGIVPRAIAALQATATADPTVARVQIHCSPRNVASARVAIKAGFAFQGTIRNATSKGGKLMDVSWYEWIPPHALPSSSSS
ncbi:acyl-CoA N-acyltransferase [Blastocladiella britannica]|nr:acyl-CoA N-acyltransferase [Blastocladiella britannica]